MQANIRFHESVAEKFEYPSEEEMLEKYLQEHPDEVLVLDNSWGPTESTDDVDNEDVPIGSRGLIRDIDLLRSNTSLAHSGMWKHSGFVLAGWG